MREVLKAVVAMVSLGLRMLFNYSVITITIIVEFAIIIITAAVVVVIVIGVSATNDFESK